MSDCFANDPRDGTAPPRELARRCLLVVGGFGSAEIAAKRFGVDPRTLLRAAVGLRIKRPSLTAIESVIDTVEDEATRHAWERHRRRAGLAPQLRLDGDPE